MRAGQQFRKPTSAFGASGVLELDHGERQAVHEHDDVGAELVAAFLDRELIAGEEIRVTAALEHEEPWRRWDRHLAPLAVARNRAEMAVTWPDIGMLAPRSFESGHDGPIHGPIRSPKNRSQRPVQDRTTS